MIGFNKIAAQSTFINLDNLRLSGYIFEDNFEIKSFKIKNSTGRFTPSISDIEKAEQLITMFLLHGCKKNKQQRRQYMGYNVGKNRYLFIHIMRYESKKQFSIDFPNWNTEIEPYLSETGQYKSFLYLINLNENTIGFFNDDF